MARRLVHLDDRMCGDRGGVKISFIVNQQLTISHDTGPFCFFAVEHKLLDRPTGKQTSVKELCLSQRTQASGKEVRNRRVIMPQMAT